MSDYLAHYGVKRRSGRYPWGSGENPYQGELDFRATVKQLRAKGLTDTEIARMMGMNTSEFRNRVTIEKHEEEKENIARARKLRDTGMSYVAIGKEMGRSESVIRSWLKEGMAERVKLKDSVTERLIQEVEKKKYLDVGDATELQLGISKTKLKAIIADLETKGYKTTEIYQEQATNAGQYTIVKVLTKADVDKDEIYKNREKIMAVDGMYIDGDQIKSIQPPVKIDPKRVMIKYAEDGGVDRDGLIEIRPGVEDLSLGGRNYAQVRIAMENNLYLKGMAVYNDDLPPGVDIRFNTNKSKDMPDEEVFKKLKRDKVTGEIDPDLPFGAVIRQYEYPDKNGEMHQSPINLVNDSDDWDKWSKTLSSQFLSKQNWKLAEMQLNKTFDKKQKEYDELAALTNPIVKQQLLNSFADECDSAATHLKACGFDRQKTHVLLPVPSIKEGEVFAPNYENGEEVILIRYPHAGVFEIPRLIVNNNNKEAIKMIGKDAPNAIGINSATAQQLSGADFDGDTAVVIPTKGLNLRTSKPLKELQEFNLSDYANGPDDPETSKANGFNKQMEMGKVSNLITDMTIKGAPISDIVKAVKYSMVVIDAEKHNYNWRQCRIDNDIDYLTQKYQAKPDGSAGGAATLISRASGDARIPERKAGVYVVDPETGAKKLQLYDPETGAKLYRETGRTYLEPKRHKGEDGKWVYEKDDEGHQLYKDKEKQAVIKVSKMDATDDAYTLSSGTPIENVYANYANHLKALANQSRKESMGTKVYPRDPEAAKTYHEEVESLNAKLNDVKLNTPRERQAQLVAGKQVELKKLQNPNMDKDELKKIRNKAIADARARVGASGKDVRIHFTDREWEAIQARAISPTKLKEIVRYCDQDELRSRSTPKVNSNGMSSAQISRAKALLSSGKYTQAEVAKQFGVSVSSLRYAIKENEE